MSFTKKICIEEIDSRIYKITGINKDAHIFRNQLLNDIRSFELQHVVVNGVQNNINFDCYQWLQELSCIGLNVHPFEKEREIWQPSNVGTTIDIDSNLMFLHDADHKDARKTYIECRQELYASKFTNKNCIRMNLVLDHETLTTKNMKHYPLQCEQFDPDIKPAYPDIKLIDNLLSGERIDLTLYYVNLQKRACITYSQTVNPCVNYPVIRVSPKLEFETLFPSQALVSHICELAEKFE